MYQVVVMWNLTRPDQELSENIDNIKLRGYNNKETFITGEFAWKIAEEKIRPLSVSNVSDRYCPTRRDLYFRKGVNRLPRGERTGRDTWGSKTGILVENYITNILGDSNITTHNFSNIIEFSDRKHEDFVNNNYELISRLEELEEESPEEIGNTEWLKKLLKSNGRAEFALKHLNEILKESTSISSENILTGENAKIYIDEQELRDEHIKQIGINLPATPDFIIPEYGIVGDIKTGVEFKPHFQLTCAGYALAYENLKGKGNDINWGIIYFFPTRNPSFFRKSITFAQVYIFPIDDYLRKEFLAKRDEAYSIISKEQKPHFPKPNEREHCKHCKFVDICNEDGLDSENSGLIRNFFSKIIRIVRGG